MDDPQAFTQPDRPTCRHCHIELQGDQIASGQCADCAAWDCPTCKGRGTVNPLTAPAGFFCVSTTDCPSCDGTGEL